MPNCKEIIHRQRVFEAVGKISDILSSNTALIQFEWQGKGENAVMKNDKFYYNGRTLNPDDGLDNFMSIGTEVRFTAHTVENTEYRECKWYVTMCWLYNSPQCNRVVTDCGLVEASGHLLTINVRRGIIEFLDGTLTKHRVLFLASKLFINEKRFTGKCLSEVLQLGDSISFDAIPCIPEENDEGCSWFSTCAYRGKRPQFLSIEKVDVIPPTNSSTPIKLIKTESPTNGHESLEVNSGNFKAQCMQILDQYVHNPQTLFVSGKGMIMNILNEEFGVMLGIFKLNRFETILFHRRSVFLYKHCLTRSNLMQIFQPGDRVKFIAVATAKNFPINWIAIQVGIDESGCEESLEKSSNCDPVVNDY